MRTYTFLIGCVALPMIMATTTSAQNPTLDVRPATVEYKGTLPAVIDRELFFGNPKISGAQLSPDGRFITFMKPLNDTRNVWIKGINEPFEAARPLTADERPVPGYFWSHDSKYVLYVQDAKGDENYHVYAVDPMAKPAADANVASPRALTSGEGVRAQINDLPRSKPGTLYVGLNDRDPAYHDLYALDIETGKKTLIYENKDQVAGFDFDHAGTLRLATKSTDSGGTEIYRIEEGGKLSKIYDCSVDESCGTLAFGPDNKRLYIISNKGQADKSELMWLDPKTGKTELVEKDPLDEVDFGSPILSDRTHELLGTVYVGDKPRIYWRNKSWEADYKWLQKELPGSEISLGSSTSDEQKIIVSANSDTDPGTVYLFEREPRKLTMLYKPRPEVPTADLAEMKPVRYKSKDGLEIPAYLTLPKGVEAKNLPVVMFIHGGPWGRDMWGYNPYAQFWANRGYAVLQPNFRASTGYGKNFLNSGNGAWGKAMQDDITAGVDYLIEQGIADKDRVGIMGGSYGGYATLAGLAFTPDVYAAGVSIVGPSNLITLLNSIPAYWASFRKQMYVRMADPDTEEGRAWLKERSPLNSATKINDPLLVVQGANDPRVKQAESDQIVVALRDLGRPVEYIVAPDEGHGFNRPENNMAMIAASERFFAKHLGGRYQADMPEAVATRLKEITVDPKSVVLMQAPSENETKAQRPKPVRQPEVGEQNYKINIDMAGQKISMDVLQSVTKTPAGYTITQTVTSPMGNSSDEVMLEGEELQMKQRKAEQGPATVTLDYTNAAVKGMIEMGGNTIPVDNALDGLLFSDGPADNVLITTLPLADGYTATLRMLDAQSMAQTLSKLTVKGSEQIELPSGKTETWRVEVKPADGSAGETVYFVEKGGKHRLVKVMSKVPAMNGAMMEQVLVE